MLELSQQQPVRTGRARSGFFSSAANNFEKVKNSSTRYLATLANEKNPQVKGYLVAKLNSKPLIVP